MTDFDPAEMEAIIRENRSTAKPSDMMIARMDHILGYLRSIALAQDRLQDTANLQIGWTKGIANHLGYIRGLLTAILIVLAIIAWNGFGG